MLDFLRRRRLRLPGPRSRTRKRTVYYFLFWGTIAGLWLAVLLSRDLRITVSYSWEWWLLLVILVSAVLAHLKRLHAEDSAGSSIRIGPGEIKLTAATITQSAQGGTTKLTPASFDVNNGAFTVI